MFCKAPSRRLVVEPNISTTTSHSNNLFKAMRRNDTDRNGALRYNRLLGSLQTAAKCAFFAAFVACKSAGIAPPPKSTLPPPLPTVTAVLPEEGGSVRVIALSCMSWSTNLLSHVEGNAMIYLEHSRAQTAYKLYLVNAAYKLWRGNGLSSNVFLITNVVAASEAITMRTPWHIDLRKFAFCSEGNCFIFSTTFLSFSRECACRDEQRVQAGASDWPKLYYNPAIQQEIQTWKFGLSPRS
jgi:hypothetical protein